MHNRKLVLNISILDINELLVALALGTTDLSIFIMRGLGS